jgi:DNA-binding MarR family transcriptional regulator
LPTPGSGLQTLAEFRYQLRLFLQFSETAAQKCGLPSQQHQLLLQIAGAPDKVDATISYAAARLALRHNTVVELSTRCEEAGLVVRKQTGSDRRRVLLELTPRGREKVEALSVDHARELNEFAPKLMRTLTRLRVVNRKPGKRAARRDSGL